MHKRHRVHRARQRRRGAAQARGAAQRLPPQVSPRGSGRPHTTALTGHRLCHGEKARFSEGVQSLGLRSLTSCASSGRASLVPIFPMPKVGHVGHIRPLSQPSVPSPHPSLAFLFFHFFHSLSLIFRSSIEVPFPYIKIHPF